MNYAEHWVETLFQKSLAACSNEEIYFALLRCVKEKTQDIPLLTGSKRLYYISAEFLLGKLLGNHLLNLGLRKDVEQELALAGKQLSEIEEWEMEPSLGNGGLGRLAACFLDSIATLGLPGDGIGLNYHFGLFRQYFEENKQREEINPWMESDGWLKRSPLRFSVPFGGFSLNAVLWEMAVTGYRGGKNRLRLFDVETVDETIVKNKISFDKTKIPQNLTLFLYPDDSDEAGQLLRVYQEYFMVSAAAQLILFELEEAGHPPESLPRHAAIQINDTHPSMIIPELVRLLTERGIEIRAAAALVEETCAYTNHTIMAEALETWPLSYIEKVAPQLVPILQQLDAIAKERHAGSDTAIIDAQSKVHMARMDIHFGKSVNGVAALHTDILKNETFPSFFALYPQKFNNKTNGIAFRRWLDHCNPLLSRQITEWIGDGWKQNAQELSRLLDKKNDDHALERMDDIKKKNKRALCAYLEEQDGHRLSEDAVFDIQIKRFHEYKRQQMNALYAIYQYRRIRAGILPARPIVTIFGGKAAPSYTMAKDIMHVILCLQELIRNDEQVRPWFQLVMVENYNVTYAERLIPACDLSEQISLASKEASGTGNMKLMLNGAVTLGTLDGANVEIAELVGPENIFLFGADSATVIKQYQQGGYCPASLYRGDAEIEALVDFIVGEEMREIGDANSLFNVYKELVSKDFFKTLLDLKSYIHTKNQALAAYEDRRAWCQKMLHNTAMAGFFSSDRTIAQYNQDIWQLQ